MKAMFVFKPTEEELIPQDAFVIEKTVTLSVDEFDEFVEDPLKDYEFIKENIDLMYHANKTHHCILVTSEEHDFGILVQSEGYHYARYAAYLKK